MSAPEGAYATVAAWHSGAAWFDALMDALGTADAERLRRRARVSVGTLLMVARADWLSADANTGRGVTTAHETVAATLGMSGKTVQRSRALLEALGFAVTIQEGRYLTRAEREAARAAHGGRQVRAASLRALTMPRPQSVENVQLPRRGEDLKQALVKKFSPRRASAHKEAAPRLATTKSTPKLKQVDRPSERKPRPIELQRLAAHLIERLPWLARATATRRAPHLGSVCDVLTRAGIDAHEWNASDVLEAIARWHQQAGRKTLTSQEQKDPLAYLGWQLRVSILPNEETPASRHRRLRQTRVEAQIERQLVLEEERRRIEETDSDEVRRIIEQSNREIAERNRAKRYNTSTVK